MRRPAARRVAAGAAQPGALPRWLLPVAAFGIALTGWIPGEAVVEGATIAWATLWLVLAAVFALRQWLVPTAGRWDTLDLLALLWMIWIVVDAFVAGQRSNARAAWNAAWTWVALLATFLVLRRLMASQPAGRALVALMISVAAANACHGIYQFAVTLPAQRAQFENATPEERIRMLREAGVSIEPDSPTVKQFEDRLKSTEPFASFGLANSLAGFLVPWFIAGLFLFDGQQTQLRGARRAAVAAGLLSMVICLVLTKSRTAWIAALLSLPMVWMWRNDARHRRWIVWLGAAVLVVAVVIGAIMARALDRQVVTEAVLSLRYRWQYWQAAWAMFRDHPWFGCGPGNFQTYYVQYKLPQASETVADPHQFILEIAATMGLPGLLLAVAMLLLGGVRCASLLARCQNPASPTGAPPSTSPLLLVSLGGAAAALLAPLYGNLVDVPAEIEPILGLPVLWCIGLPAAAAMLAGLARWVRDGAAFRHAWSVAWLALAVNLLAAGGISYPNVAGSWWLLCAACSPVCLGAPAPVKPIRMVLPAALLTTLAVAGIWIGYRPVIVGQAYLRQAATANRPQEAFERLAKAAQVDPWNPEPWKWTAQLLFEQWATSPTQEHWLAWQAALDEAKKRDPLSYPLAEWEGQLALRAYRLQGKQQDLERAVKAFRRGTEIYPNSAFAFAQLAWVTSLVGQPERAARYAARALELDAMHPHSEWKLSARRLPDPELSRGGKQPPSAEQLMHQLRNTIALGGASGVD
ncbi:MAG: ligase [Pirellulaceae bacterium]|nr:MAG: ligase [Pirellulaceae bacterium]